MGTTEASPDNQGADKRSSTAIMLQLKTNFNSGLQIFNHFTFKLSISKNMRHGDHVGRGNLQFG